MQIPIQAGIWPIKYAERVVKQKENLTKVTEVLARNFGILKD